MDIQIFQNPEFGEIRTMVMPDGQIGFVGKDVASVLGYVDPQKTVPVPVFENNVEILWLGVVNRPTLLP